MFIYTLFKKLQARAQNNEKRKLEKKLSNWFKVTWDDTYIYREVSPPKEDAWSDKFRWDDIERICFEATDYFYSDDLIFFTNGREESYLIPTEADRGSELWAVVLDKGLFDAELAIQATTAIEGVFCTPKLEK